MRQLRYAMAVCLATSAAAIAQRGGGGMAGGGLSGGGGAGGVHVDAKGVLRSGSASGVARAKAPDLDERIAKRSDLRRVSLRQLDAQLRRLREAKNPIPEELRCLAGLVRIEFVVFDPDAKDIMLAGPAEGWSIASDGRAIGSKSKRPVLLLENLAAALRCVLNGPGAVDCSIDPTRSGLANIRKLTPEGIDGKTPADDFRSRVLEGLGLQTVRTGGVPIDSKFAAIMVEADYRMKRLALGVERFAGLNSHLDTLVALAEAGSRNFNLARWWFTPDYRPVEANEAGTVYQIRGPALKLLNEEVLFDETGQRRGTGRASDDWDRFCKSFNEKLPALESKIAPIADLHNLFDLMLAAGLVRHLERGDWLAGSALLDEAIYPLPRHPVARRAEPVVGYHLDKNMRQRRYIFTFTYGGVTMNPRAVLGVGIATGGSAMPSFAKPGASTGSVGGSTSRPAKNDPERAERIDVAGDWWQDFDRRAASN